MTSAASSTWIVPQPRPEARWRLYCLPSAGSGAAVFFPWASAAPTAIEVAALRLPGRESRLREPLLGDIESMTALVDATLDEGDARPWAFFGHSMGALLAFEVARRRFGDGRPGPRHLFVSGRHAPGLPEAKAPWHALDDAALRERLGGLGGMPATLLDDAEIRAMLFPIIRADLGACERFAPREGSAVPCGITAFGGTADPLVTEEALRAWGAHTTGPFTCRRFEGGHFFHVERRDALLEAIAAGLDRLD